MKFFNRRCANDSSSGLGSPSSIANIHAIETFLRIHHLHVAVVERLSTNDFESFQLGPGTTLLGTLLWDTSSQHVHVITSRLLPMVPTTCVSSLPWSRSSVGSDDAPSLLPTNMRLFRPSNVSSEVAPDGYFLIDSFHYFKQGKKSLFTICQNFLQNCMLAQVMSFTLCAREVLLLLIAAMELRCTQRCWITCLPICSSYFF